MTWQPGLIGSRRGHVQLCAKYVGLDAHNRLTYTQLIGLTIPCQHKLSELVGENLRGFYNVSGTVYYIGKSAVFKTDMDRVAVLPVYFNPVAVQTSKELNVLRPILFRKLHKLEWLFS